MDDFGLTMDDLIRIDGIGEADVARSEAVATLTKLERMGMIGRGWHEQLFEAPAPRVSTAEDEFDFYGGQ